MSSSYLINFGVIHKAFYVIPECQGHIFDNQHTCKFPFYHEGTEYRGCTGIIGGWPACKIDNAGDPLWATCYDSCPMGKLKYLL